LKTHNKVQHAKYHYSLPPTLQPMHSTVMLEVPNTKDGILHANTIAIFSDNSTSSLCGLSTGCGCPHKSSWKLVCSELDDKKLPVKVQDRIQHPDMCDNFQSVGNGFMLAWRARLWSMNGFYFYRCGQKNSRYLVRSRMILLSKSADLLERTYRNQAPMTAHTEVPNEWLHRKPCFSSMKYIWCKITF